MLSPPQLLPENAGLAFVGEIPWTAAELSRRQTKSFSEARNPTGRPNADALRRFVGFQSGHITEHVRIDFPLHFTGQEAALYLKPHAHLRSQLQNPGSHWWLNPNADPTLRTALTRLERYLATPLALENPAWNWIDSQLLPEPTLLVVARDDDFTRGILRSRCFNFWWTAWRSTFSPIESVMSFPFPWSPHALLSSLTRDQEEKRHAVARAARNDDAQDQLDSVVADAYGLPGDLAQDEVIAALVTLNRQRAAM